VALQHVLDTVPELADPLSVAPLEGGLTNTNYKVVTAGGAYVVRISNKDSSLLAIDRQNELHNTIAAADAGVGAPVVAALPEHDALVLGFLEGRSLTADDLRQGDRLELVADACRRLHAARPFLHDFDLF
jgi:Ser/Thr protein kinase RdoA (MazF antagonist)